MELKKIEIDDKEFYNSKNSIIHNSILTTWTLQHDV